MPRSSRILGFFCSLVFAMPIAAEIPVPPPSSFELLQNAPASFCTNTGTRIEFVTPRVARVELVVRSTDGSQVLRTLTNSDLLAGAHVVLWDGRDGSGTAVADGAYPYQMRAYDTQSALLFDATKTATVDCDLLPVKRDAWSSAKRRYH